MTGGREVARMAGAYTDAERETGAWVRGMAAEDSRGFQSFYHTGAWERARRGALERDRHECQRCRAAGRYARATVVHHVRHLRDAPELALSQWNLVSLCAACHEEEHGRGRQERGGFRNEERW